MSVYYQVIARDWLIAAFARLLLRIKRADTIACRECGQEVQIEGLLSFIEAGCLNCGCTKLKAVKQC